MNKAATLTANGDLVDRIETLLPQTQCEQCGYQGCRPYAEAIADGSAPINRCPPGGDTTIARLGKLLGVAPLALDPAFGPSRPFARARIDEATCIGCTLCIRACPVDAIVGATKWMHTVISDRCTGCELCLPPCPVDCIAMIPARREWTTDDAVAARTHYQMRAARLGSLSRISRSPIDERGSGISGLATTRDERRQAVAAALARARARRGERRGSKR